MLIQQERTMGVSKLRFLPKSKKVRPIVNLGSKVQLPAVCYGRGKRAESVNRQLQDVFHVLNYEKVNREIFSSINRTSNRGPAQQYYLHFTQNSQRQFV